MNAFKAQAMLLAAVCAIGQGEAGRNPIRDPGCVSYQNSKCDPSSSTYTCTDIACDSFTGTAGPYSISGGSSKFVADKNVQMKICVANSGTKCATHGRNCGNYYYYLTLKCGGLPVSYQPAGYQTDCQAAN